MSGDAAEPIELTYTCRFIGGPLDGAEIECNDLHDEAVPHGNSNAIYARVGQTEKRFVGFFTDLSEGIQRCQEFRDELEADLCDGM